MKKIIIMLVLSLFVIGCSKFEEREFLDLRLHVNVNSNNPTEVQKYILSELKILYGRDDIKIIENSYEEIKTKVDKKFFKIKIGDCFYFVKVSLVEESVWNYEHYYITVRKINNLHSLK